MSKLLRTYFCTLSIAATSLAACGDDLGPCDEAAASQLVYSDTGLVATKGQALMHDSCGAASFCHSRNAKGKDRFGVPKGLDFDMLPTPQGWPTVIEHRDDIWASILDGSMPPEGEGQRSVTRGNWSYDPYRSNDAQMLPTVTSKAGKAVLRNWLACGAPVSGQTRAPAWLVPDAEADLTDWQGIFDTIMRPQCATASGCHNSATAGGLVLVDACDAYRQVLEVGNCEGQPRVTPGDVSSPFLNKMEASSPTCGGPMPPSGSLPEAQVAAIRAWIEAGAPAVKCP